MKNLETAQPNAGLRRIAIDPVSRVEGHGKVTLLVDDENNIQQVRLHIVEFRGFERFIQGRPFWEIPMVTQRLCGICPVSHHLAAGKAIDMLVGARQLTPGAEKLRRLLHFGQTLQSHALHFFHLASPDLVFGFDAPAIRRNVIELLDSHTDIALKGVKLRKFGQEVIRILSGKRIHGSLVIPGGVNKSLSREDISYLKALANESLPWAIDAAELAKQLFLADKSRHQRFARIRSPLVSLVADDGALDLYHGGLRAKSPDGSLQFDHWDYCNYGQKIREQVKPWSYMKFPFLNELGPDEGWYRVGPLARVLNCDHIGTPRAERARVAMLQEIESQEQGSLLYHWTRMIELLHCAEAISALLEDQDLSSDDLIADRGKRNNECVGVIEAPRGTLFHHYRVGDDDMVEKANLIVSTTSNNQAMNEAVRDVAINYLDGHEITEPLLNHIEVAIRAYDPCLSCATHAIGQMPMTVELQHLNGDILHRLSRDDTGEIHAS